MKFKPTLTIRAVAIALATIGSAPPGTYIGVAFAQTAGDLVVFIVPTGSGTGPGERVIYISKSSGGSIVPFCSGNTDQHPIQSVVLIDPGQGRATRLSNLITLSVNGASQTTPIPDGTTLGNPVLLCPASPCCTEGLMTFDKFSATVLH
jgi:hypothetical protein